MIRRKPGSTRPKRKPCAKSKTPAATIAASVLSQPPLTCSQAWARARAICEAERGLSKGEVLRLRLAKEHDRGILIGARDLLRAAGILDAWMEELYLERLAQLDDPFGRSCRLTTAA